MTFDARCFWYAKDLEKVSDYEDAYAVAPQDGRAAIADGVSSAIFSRRWAQLLTGTSVATPPCWDNPQSVQDWIKEQRKSWSKSINVHALPWHQRAKLEQSGGASAAFLWVEVVPGEQPETLSLRAIATGDCCLFHLRGADVLARFPLSCAADFDRDPVTWSSSSRVSGPTVPFQTFTADCAPGDWIILSTDALGKWLYRLSDHGEPIDWAGLWSQDAFTWTQRISELRELSHDQRIRVDDTTLVILRLGVSPPQQQEIEASLAATPTQPAEAGEDEAVVVAELVEEETALNEPAAADAEQAAASADSSFPAEVSADETADRPVEEPACQPAAAAGVEETSSTGELTSTTPAGSVASAEAPAHPESESPPSDTEAAVPADSTTPAADADAAVPDTVAVASDTAVAASPSPTEDSDRDESVAAATDTAGAPFSEPVAETSSEVPATTDSPQAAGEGSAASTTTPPDNQNAPA